MKKKIEEIREKISSYIADFTLFKLLKLIFTGALILLLITLFIFACRLVAGFIVANYELLLLCGSIVVAVIYIIWCKRVNNETTQAVQMRCQTKFEEEQEKAQLEDIYAILQALLYRCINDTANITKLPVLHSPSSLEAPTHCVITNGYHTFQFLVSKDSTSIDIPRLKEILNNRIRQLLSSGEVPGVTQAIYISNSGRTYPRFLIDSITNLGFLQINMVIVGEKYISHVERVQVAKSTPLDNSDLDF